MKTLILVVIMLMFLLLTCYYGGDQPMIGGSTDTTSPKIIDFTTETDSCQTEFQNRSDANTKCADNSALRGFILDSSSSDRLNYSHFRCCPDMVTSGDGCQNFEDNNEQTPNDDRMFDYQKQLECPSNNLMTGLYHQKAMSDGKMIDKLNINCCPTEKESHHQCQWYDISPEVKDSMIHYQCPSGKIPTGIKYNHSLNEGDDNTKMRQGFSLKCCGPDVEETNNDAGDSGDDNANNNNETDNNDVKEEESGGLSRLALTGIIIASVLVFAFLIVLMLAFQQKRARARGRAVGRPRPMIY